MKYQLTILVFNPGHKQTLRQKKIAIVEMWPFSRGGR